MDRDDYRAQADMHAGVGGGTKKPKPATAEPHEHFLDASRYYNPVHGNTMARAPRCGDEGERLRRMQLAQCRIETDLAALRPPASNFWQPDWALVVLLFGLGVYLGTFLP